MNRTQIEILSVDGIHSVPRSTQRQFFVELLYALSPEEVLELVKQGFTPDEIRRFRDIVLRLPYT